MKRFLSLILLLGMLLPFGVLAVAADSVTAEGLRYSVTEEAVTIVGYDGTEGMVKIPVWIEDKPVRSIGAGAFANRADLSALYLPESLRKVEAGAFRGCSSLSTVYFAGNEEDWAAVEIAADNEALSLAEQILNYAPGIDGPLASNKGPDLNTKADTDTYPGNPPTQVVGTIIGGGYEEQNGVLIAVLVAGGVLLIAGAVAGGMLWRKKASSKKNPAPEPKKAPPKK